MMTRKPTGSKDGIKPSVDRHVHLLKGLIKCQECGSTMTPVPSGKKDKKGNPYLYYTCTEVSHYRNGSKCDVRSFSARDFENTIIQYLKDLGENRVLIHRCIAQANKGTGENLKKLEREEKRLKRRSRPYLTKSRSSSALESLAGKRLKRSPRRWTNWP